MGSLFSSPKSQPTPDVPPPVAVPDIDPNVGDVARKRAKSRKGFRQSILAGSLAPQSGGNQLLG